MLGHAGVCAWATTPTLPPSICLLATRRITVGWGGRIRKRVDGNLQVESFKTHEERIREIRAFLSIQPERAYDPADPNADEDGYVWVIAVTLHKDAETLYLCTNGCIR